MHHILAASFDVASNICQALDGGGGAVVTCVYWAGTRASGVPLHHVSGVRVRAVPVPLLLAAHLQRGTLRGRRAAVVAGGGGGGSSGGGPDV